MPLEITLTGNNKVRLNQQYPVVAGVDGNNVPRIIRTDEEGVIDFGGIIYPKFTDWSITYFGATNNIRYVIYTLQGNEVARWTFAYRNGGVADNDLVTSGAFTVT